VKPRLQGISMRVQAAGEHRYSPWPRAPSSEPSSSGAVWAKAIFDFPALMARLKPCPFKTNSS
jgi:hypothetical protein